MRSTRYVNVCLGVVTAALLLSAVAFAGTAGKVAGTVYNSETGEPLAGATIKIAELDLVCVSDADGEFFLIDIPVGTYTLLSRSIGYAALEKSEVKVLLDLTTPVDFHLDPSTIATDEVVRVRAERPTIQKDRTSSVNTITRDELRNLPNALTLTSIIETTAGTVTDANGQLHIRGGRDGTSTFYFDDIPVQDPFYGVAGTRISPDALEELDIVPGGFSAEYGEALSGVINAMTQEGSKEYHGKLKFYDGLTKSYDVNEGDFEKMKRIGRNSGVANLGGPVPYLYDNLKATFFTSTEYRDIEGYLPHNRLISFSETGKLALRPMPSMKLSLFGSYYRATGQRYIHRDVNGYSYDFNLDGLGLIKTKSSRLGIRWTYTPKENIVANARLNHFKSWTKLAPEHLWDTYWKDWPGYSEDVDGNYNGTIQDYNYIPSLEYYGVGFTEPGDFYPVYAYRENMYNSFSGDVLMQLNKQHQIKVGAEYRSNKLSWDNKQFFNEKPYGEKYDVSPKYAAGYIQDKMEFQQMVINAGVRFDYLNAEIGYWGNAVEKTDWRMAEPKFEVSPRFGISYPISDNTVFHSNYGVYLQVPLYSYMYTNLQAELNSGYPLVGNPDLEPEKTVGYELGVTHMLNQDVSIELVTYYRDITNMTSTEEIVYGGGEAKYSAYTNADYGSVKGFDVVLHQRPSNNLAATINYSYMIARGNASYPYELYYGRWTIPEEDRGAFPVREYDLAFDQRHTVSANVDYRVPRDFKGRLFGIGLPGAWGVNTLFSYGSGMPYTKTDSDGRRIGTPNEGRMPATYSVDLKVNKDYYLTTSDEMFLSVFLEVENPFDRRNVINVYSTTGEPDDDGDGALYSGGDPDRYRIYQLLAKDPQNYDTPRTIRWGLEFVF